MESFPQPWEKGLAAAEMRQHAIEIQKLKDELEAVKAENKRLEELATKDTLTGLLNRRGVDEAFRNLTPKPAAAVEHRSAVPTPQYKSFLALMIDIDHFKEVNDTYGHEAGDAAIKAVAEYLKGAMRDHDLVSRHGGDEFLLFLPDAKAEGVIEKLSGVKVLVEIKKGDGAKETIEVALSGGIKEFELGADLETAAKEVDEILYKAKRGGRNKIHSPDKE